MLYNTDWGDLHLKVALGIFVEIFLTSLLLYKYGLLVLISHKISMKCIKFVVWIWQIVKSQRIGAQLAEANVKLVRAWMCQNVLGIDVICEGRGTDFCQAATERPAYSLRKHSQQV